jgi:hypothetical protein
MYTVAKDEEDAYKVGMTSRLDTWIKVVSISCSVVVLPGIGWAWNTSQELTAITGKVQALSQQLDMDRRSANAVVEELRALRASIDSMRADLLQRMTRVETQMEKR